ncbi:ATP-binding protein [Pyrobaculum ferrireducens]|uniref:AAA ATPase n=1 Tax=Pyrobaculum ferrireducens TaxID=1104324 RepID=G7VEX3_9CREN|nr:ATP-binding protein [Pyrobaculum ferrireducens]AET34138.1 AAA ATPase [Pyrobaculum ferrireducens]
MLGEKIGVVSASEVIAVGPQHRITVEIPFDVYAKHLIKVGDLLLIETRVHKSLVLAQVSSIKRQHLAALLGIRALDAPIEDSQGLSTPAVIELEPLAECASIENCDPVQPASPIDPLSSVYIPSSEVVAKMLGIPQVGVLLGKLYINKELDVEVRLPPEAVFMHILAVGTTGAGKTTFLKNIALSAYWDLGITPIAFDFQGDFIHLTIPAQGARYRHLNRLTVVWPVTRSFLHRESETLIRYANEFLGEGEEPGDLSAVSDKTLFSKAVGYGLGKLFMERVMGGGYEVEDVEVEADRGRVKWISIRLPHGVEIKLIPWALELKDIIWEIPTLFPFFGTPRIALLYDDIVTLIINKIRHRNSIDIDSVVGTLHRIYKLLEEEIKIHKSQKDSVVRGFTSLKNTGIIDVWWDLSMHERKRRVFFGEPSYGDLFSEPVVVFLDLFRERPTAASIVVYRLLRKLLEVKDEELRRGAPRPAFVLIDEAHEYFPQSGEDLSREAVEDMINRITRLGRVRRIGVVFATHMPEDLNALVLQLSNTKVVFRSDEAVLEKFGLREYSQLLRIAPNGVAVARSHSFRTGVLAFRTLPPQTLHRSHVDQLNLGLLSGEGH